MVSLDRWQRAQQYERNYWSSLAGRIAEGSTSQLDWYRWRAEQLVRRLRALGLERLVDGCARVLEVGCGPIGIVAFFPAAERVAIDPLEPYYGTNATLAALRDSAVKYRQGSVEALPCETGQFDLIIIENCIDHVQDVHGGMRELKRVIRPGSGTLYLTVNCRTRWGFVVHRVLSRLRVDAGHPHTFTPPRAQALLDAHGFRTIDFHVTSYRDARREDLAAPERRARIKGLIGISEFFYSAIALCE